MSLAAGCPRCSLPIAPAAGPEQAVLTGEAWLCPDHGEIRPLWHPDMASYEDFVDQLARAESPPTLLPWPLGPGWQVSDFGVVTGRARYTCVSGTTELDGPVDVLVVVEEAGVGLGARVAGTQHDDPGREIARGRPTARIWVEAQSVSVWPVSTSDSGGEWDRTVVAGEAGGRWLWLVLRPASAALLLRQEWRLRDASGLGPALLEVPFGGTAASW
ncbi:DUF6758 family protein [Nocardioides insulae]|uniref:DUF6758 family protein n=1 Tax=Nocardioides insulae TaxID=394734 RepID=UPI000404DC96|nr:DUF6758 family protein [Nocardioides insulae]